jgi:hypothetical protein
MYKSLTHFSVGDKIIRSLVHTSFDFSKVVHCKDSTSLNHVKEKLDRLADENFNRVRIPEYSYEVLDSKTISYNVRFIKGVGIGTLVPHLQKIVREDVLERDEDWTFSDFHTGNFLMEYETGNIYAVDFLSYCYAPDKKWRKEKWDLSICRDKIIWGKLMDGIPQTSRSNWIN